MSGSWNSWPALAQPGGWPEGLAFQQAVWGKFRGSREDFGWIGRSAGFDAAGLEHQLSLGSEDLLDRTASFWRVSADKAFAIRIYASPVVDRSGRRGLEKHFLECDRTTLPRAGAAAVLLTAAAAKSDAANVSSATAGEGPIRLTQLSAGTAYVKATLPRILESGIADLERLRLGRALAGMYEVLLTGRGTALLQSPEPLRPESLAALLLPLDRAIADRISIAGWIISSRFDPAALKASWNVVIHDGTMPPETPPIAGGMRRQAERLAAALLSADPDALRSERPTAFAQGPAPAQAKTSPAALESLIDFAYSPDRRATLRVATRITADANGRAALTAALDSIRMQMTQPPRLDGPLLDARRRDLQIKMDLIKEAAIKLDPALSSLRWTIE